MKIVMLMYFYWVIIVLDKLVSAAVTIRILSVVQFVWEESTGHMIKLIGNESFHILHLFLSCPGSFNMYSDSCYLPVLFSTSLFDNCDFPFVDAGIIN